MNIRPVIVAARADDTRLLEEGVSRAFASQSFDVDDDPLEDLSQCFERVYEVYKSICR
jgi:hypothetical protein